MMLPHRSRLNHKVIRPKPNPSSGKCSGRRIAAPPGKYKIILLFCCGLAFNYVAVFSAYYLVKPRWKWVVTPGSWERSVLISTVSVIAIFLWGFARPRAEIAAIGQTRLWRTARIVGSVVAGLVVAALAKWLLSGGR